MGTIRSKIRKWLGIVRLLSGGTPRRIHLERRETIDWSEPDKIQPIARTLIDSGFQSAGLFSIRELYGVAIWSFVHVPNSIHGVICDHPVAGIVIDLVTLYEDGGSFTATTAPDRGLARKPEHAVIRELGLNPGRLAERMLRERPERSMKPVSAADFPEVYEKSWADEIDWRNARGISEQEIRTVAEKSRNATPSDEIVSAAYQIQNLHTLRALDETLRERFVSSFDIPAKTWKDVGKRIFFVHERLPRDFMIETLKQIGHDTAIPFTIPAEECYSSIRETFAQFASAQGQGRLVKIGELTAPVAADVWATSTDASVLTPLRAKPARS